MSHPVESNVIWLTQEANSRLQEELDHLRGPARADLAARIGEARDEGDLRENGGYHAAKEEQGKAEARIRQLEDMLRRAEVGELPKPGDPIGPGMVVTVRFAGDDDTEKFLLGSRELLALDDSVAMEVYSPQSPLGSAVRGLQVGESTSYEAPNGRTVALEVVAAEPFRS